MRISFVGKGGSGKSTLTASFASYLSKNTIKPVVVFDADLNVHVPKLLGFDAPLFNKHLSHPEATKSIKKWLIGKNNITNLGAFRKTTPPTRKSNILNIEKLNETPLTHFGLQRDNLFLYAVGTYQEEDIGASCYHNNLAILESILNHTNDKNGYIVTDMVAGIDSFGGTLHAQFDLTCIIVEPTKRSVEVYNKYETLAKEAGISDSLMVVGNKIRNIQDKEFIEKNIPKEKILGYFNEDIHIREIDQNEAFLNFKKLDKGNIELLAYIKFKIDSLLDNRQNRLKKLWGLHKKYVNQDFIRERFGDLLEQIDIEFSFDK
jgi:CO dehydrogenase maturation factor